MERVSGIVTKIVGSSSHVDAGPAGQFDCDLRGRLFRQLGMRLAVGDRVELLPQEGEEANCKGVIESVAPRGSCLRRTRDFKRDQVLCANVDRIFLVVGVLDPPYKRAFVDRVLVGAERDQLELVLVFNKVDLCDPEYRELVGEDAAVYQRLGYRALLVSAATGEGMPELQAEFAQGVSAVVGPSGVGKSTLLNRVSPGLGLRTNEVSEQDGRGRHTTTSAELVTLAEGGYVVDTPGLRAFGLWDLEVGQIEDGFREIAQLAPQCRFRDCAHVTEPKCAVQAALETGELDEERYHSFIKLRDEIAANKSDRQANRRR